MSNFIGPNRFITSIRPAVTIWDYARRWSQTALDMEQGLAVL